MYQEIKNDNHENIGEININHLETVFDFYEVKEEYLSPYDYSKFFNKKMSFNKFTNYITNLMNYNLGVNEIIHFKKFYSSYSFKKKKLGNLINKTENNDLLNNLIVIKRLENLYDFIVVEDFDAVFKIYLDDIISTVRKNIKKYINNSNF